MTRRVMRLWLLVAAIVGVTVTSACSARMGDAGLTGAALPAQAARARLTVKYSQIQHVVIVVQENRSMDNLFQGFPNADVRSYGDDGSGNRIALQPVPLSIKWDIVHSSGSFYKACDGVGKFHKSEHCKMDGFDSEVWSCGKSNKPPCPNENPPYSYVPADETQPLFQIGEQNVLADRMFGSNFDSSSFVSHQYIIAAQAKSSANYPDAGWGCDGTKGDGVPTVDQQRDIGPDISPCFDYTTLGDELDAASLPWRFYTYPVGHDGGVWSAYQAVKHIYYGSDWSSDVVTPATQFYSDVSHGKLPAVSWITPTCQNSDHAGCTNGMGPDWVASLVNAVGESKYWKSTVMFIFWDDYGGWYDHVAPKPLDYDGLGFRVPLLIVSAYAKSGYVSHTPYEHGSMLKFIEQQWDLPAMAKSDARANNPAPECFDFSGKPKPFKKIKTAYNAEFFRRQPPDLRPPDDQ